MRKIFLFLSFMALSFSAFATVNLSDDNILIGKHSGSSNPSLGFYGHNNKIRYNNSSAHLEFSNNGSTWTEFGSIVDVIPEQFNSSPVTALSTDTVILMATGSSAITLNLPAASGLSGHIYQIIQTSASNSVTIDPNSSETICGQTTIKLNALNDAVSIVSDGSNWVGLGDSCKRNFSVYYAAGNTSTVCGTGSCTPYGNTGPTALTIANAGSSAYTLTVPSGTCSTILLCSVNGGLSNVRAQYAPSAAPTTTTYAWTTLNVGFTAADSAGSVVCTCFR